MDMNALQKMIEEGWVSVQRHPYAPLYIYNYSQQAQYERRWNEITLACRGLIMNEQGEVIARPFPKFFNLEEPDAPPPPLEPFEVYEKMDGSLGILYWLADKPYIATRGSFVSEQAEVANDMLHGVYAHLHGQLNPDYTYLFEIIYPENRIVVDYGATRELVLLAIIETATGRDQPLADMGFPMVKRYDGLRDLHALRALEAANREGFVVRFSGGLRLKIKFEAYVRIHRTLSLMSSVRVWERLSQGLPPEDMLEDLPDEFFEWLRATVARLEGEYQRIAAEAQEEFRRLPSRKETAAYFKDCRHTAILFRMYDNRDYSDIIWKQVKPPFERPFAHRMEADGG